MENDSLRRCLAGSAASHAALVLAFLGLFRARPAPPEVYHIDFIGPTAGIINRSKEEGAASKAGAAGVLAKPAPQKDADAFNLSRVKKPLPRPSLLQGWLEPKKEVPATHAAIGPAPEPSIAPAPSAQASGSGDGGPSVAADMPNFPYPWYLTTVRSTLWDKWSERIPGMAGDCAVVFTILRDGGVVDVRVELRGVTYRQDESTPLAFQIAAGQAFRRALESARPVLLEPVMHLDILVPEEFTGSVIGGLQSRHGVIERIEGRGHLQAITALVPLAATFGYTTDLRSASQGRGTFTMRFAHYAPAR